MQDTGKFRTNTKDQFYTKSHVAKACIDKVLEIVPQSSSYLWLEPAAGNGSFLHALSDSFDSLGMDIDPASDDIMKTDFLNWEPIIKKKCIVFGNPPFGRQSSMAKAFITKASIFADIIAFILPRSFMKPSMTNVFPLKFHCLYSKELEEKSFEINQGSCSYDVPCVFQIWEKKATDREIVPKVPEIGFQYVKSDQPFDIAFRRVGGLAGKCYLSGVKDFNPQCYYFLQFNPQYVQKIPRILKDINLHEFPSNTVGPKSISKQEVNVVINEIIQKYIYTY
jgi:hypothetical protein